MLSDVASSPGLDRLGWESYEIPTRRAPPTANSVNPMTHDQIQRWLDDYVSAWRSGDPEAIGSLFTQDAAYSYRPWDSPEHTVTGREAIVASWLDNPDDPSTWDAEYHPYAVDGDRAVAIGHTRYHEGEDDDRLYHNAFVLRFAEGRCAEFHEFYVRQKL